MSAKLAEEDSRGRAGGCCGDELEAEAEAVAESEAPPHRGVIAPSLLCGCELCGAGWKRADVPLPVYRARGFSSRRVVEQDGECGRIVSSRLLCDCADCGIGWERSDSGSSFHGASLRRPVVWEEECVGRYSMRWRFWRRTSIREGKSLEMGSLWDAFGPGMHTGGGDQGGCGIQRVVESIFSKDRVHDEEEKHRCILHFPSMRELFTHEEVEHALVQLGWKPLTKRGGWRRYFKMEEPTLPYGLPTIAKLPGRSFVDAPKPIILDFVKTVNKRENRNIFCCWQHRGELLVTAGDRLILN
ncbi:hypothetical protein KC19_11G084800 [Ceratodon purpureus]|uniref:Uncharacterized protein n=1 Tax=Ceratodon purpureus TaxID=3225 RepID=A0A8T0GCT4_CERPU|nr:hypothetical protein KC19_11G084800 [Ceratodon purpureus]